MTTKDKIYKMREILGFSDKTSDLNYLQRFTKIVEKHSLCPNDALYNANGFAGEAGEVCNVIKKLQMAKIKPEWVLSNENKLPDEKHFREQLALELGDALFYLVRIALDHGFGMDELIFRQQSKLSEQTAKYGRTFLK